MKRSSSQELQSSPTSWEYISICLREGRQINCTYLQWTLKHYEKTRITIKNFISIFGRPVRLTLLPCYLQTRKQAVFSSATDQWWTDGESPPLLLSLPSMWSINRTIVQSAQAFSYQSITVEPASQRVELKQWETLKIARQEGKYEEAVSSAHITLLSYQDQDHPGVYFYLWSLSRRYFSLSALLIFRSGCRCSWCVFTFWLST